MPLVARLEFDKGFKTPSEGFVTFLMGGGKSVESHNQTAPDRLLKTQTEGRSGFSNPVSVFPPGQFDDQLPPIMSEEHLMTDRAPDYVRGLTAQGRPEPPHPRRLEDDAGPP